MSDDPTMTDQSADRHAAMAKRRAMGPSRGRPATPPEPPPEDPEFIGARRVSRRNGRGGNFDLPQKFRDANPNRDFEWKTVSVYREPIEASYMIDVSEAGWKPVPFEIGMKFGLMPPGYNGTTIEREGQRLYWRPMWLTQEARDEDEELATKQLNDKLGQQAATPVGHARRTYQEMSMDLLAPVERNV